MSRLACTLLCVALLGCKAFRAPPIPEHPAGEVAPSLGVARIGPVSGGPHGAISVEDRGQFATRLREDLVATGLFTRVLLDPRAPADVTVDASYGTRSCLSHPFVAVLTLGIVPDLSCYQSGYQLTLTGGALPRGAIVVDNQSRPITMVGWIAGPVSLLPGWWPSIPRAEEGEALRAAILAAIANDAGAPASEVLTRPAYDARRAAP